MYELMGTKKEDDEFELQIAHTLLSLLACQATRTVLLQSTQVSLAQPDDMLPSQQTLCQNFQTTAQSTLCKWPTGAVRASFVQGNQPHLFNSL